jgi:hypothetical protein
MNSIINKSPIKLDQFLALLFVAAKGFTLTVVYPDFP